MNLTSDLENLYTNAQSHDEYACQVSLKSVHYVERYFASCEIGVNGRTTAGRKAGWTDRRFENNMPPLPILGRGMENKHKLNHSSNINQLGK